MFLLRAVMAPPRLELTPQHGDSGTETLRPQVVRLLDGVSMCSPANFDRPVVPKSAPAKFGPSLPEFGLNLASLRQFWPQLRQARHEVGQLWPMLARPGRLWPKSGQTWPNSAKSGQTDRPGYFESSREQHSSLQILAEMSRGLGDLAFYSYSVDFVPSRRVQASLREPSEG